MHALIAAFAAELRRHPLPAAITAASLLEGLANAPSGAMPGGHVPRFLDAALVSGGCHPLTALFAPIADRVSWVEVSTHDMPEGFRGRYAYCEIVGPSARIPAPNIAFGAYLQFPVTWYPLHWHAAEELYFPLSGTALWTRDSVQDQPTPPGTLIHHAPHERHATRTTAEPLLALWCWTGDIRFDSYGIDEV